MKESIQQMTLEESVKRRPFIHIGNDGVTGLIRGVLIDCIELCEGNNMVLQFTTAADNEFYLELDCKPGSASLLDSFGESNGNYFLAILKIVSTRFEITSLDASKAKICFSLNKDIIEDKTIDYFKLSEVVLQIALLNRWCEIITIDKRVKYFVQNYYHFPQGIFYLFDRKVAEALGKPVFSLMFDGSINSNMYQVGLAYRTDWYPSADVTSFANHVHTVYGGSLVDGVLDGLLNAVKSFAKENKLEHYKINKKKLMNGLILVCAVRGQNFEYGGSWKESLQNAIVKKEAKRIITKLAIDFFRNQREQAGKFLWRFDTTQLTSGMY